MVAPHKTEKPTYDMICVSISSERNRPRATHKITNTWPTIDDRLLNGTGILNNYDPLSTGVPWGRTHFDQLETWGNDVNVIPSNGRRLRDRPFLRPRDGVRAQMVSNRGHSRPREEHRRGSRAQIASDRGHSRPREEHTRGSRAQMASGHGLLRPSEENATDFRVQMASGRGLLRPREENVSDFRAQLASNRGLLRPREENVSDYRAQILSDRGLLRPREVNMSDFRAQIVPDHGLLRPREENVSGFRAQMVSGSGRRATTRRMLSPYEINSQPRQDFPSLAYLRTVDPWFSRLSGSPSHDYDLADLYYMMRSRQVNQPTRFLN